MLCKPTTFDNSKYSSVLSSTHNCQLRLYGKLNKKASWISNCIVQQWNCPLKILSLISLVSDILLKTLILATCSIWVLL